MSFAVAAEFTSAISAAHERVSLTAILSEACAAMGFSFFALSHHIDFAHSPDAGVRIHNYPGEWAAWFDARGLGVSDPIHRASHMTAKGFRWREVPRLIALTKNDHLVLDAARAHGIGDGFTIPANIPGEARGSCSFATADAVPLSEASLGCAQLVGLFAFEAARRIELARPSAPLPILTDRQRECVLWVARGKTDWEIAQILGVSHATVIEHVRNARERYGTSNRLVLAVRVIFDGALCFSDVIGR